MRWRVRLLQNSFRSCLGMCTTISSTLCVAVRRHNPCEMERETGDHHHTIGPRPNCRERKNCRCQIWRPPARVAGLQSNTLKKLLRQRRTSLLRQRRASFPNTTGTLTRFFVAGGFEPDGREYELALSKNRARRALGVGPLAKVSKHVCTRQK